VAGRGVDAVFLDNAEFAECFDNDGPHSAA
jgi:hypothetical protein